MERTIEIFHNIPLISACSVDYKFMGNIFHELIQWSMKDEGFNSCTEEAFY